MSPSYDVIVVGLGAMGSATAYQLASRGLRVLGLEQFDIPHNLGSSHGSSRMIRLAYFEHPDYVPLLRRAYELWDALEAESGRKIIHITGGLYVGPPGSEVVNGSILAAKQYGIAHDLLGRAEIVKRFPQFNLPQDYRGMIDRAGGFVLPERAITAYCDLAMKRGGELHGREPVLEWKSEAAGVTVRTAKATYSAGHVVFCGGAWTGKLIRDLRVPLVVTRQVMAWFWPKRGAERFELGQSPVWAIDPPDGAFLCGFPIHPEGSAGVKVAFHVQGPPTDPDTDPRLPTQADETELRRAMETFIPDAPGSLLSMRVCLYTNSPDHSFIVDRHPEYPNVTVACGFSGHGFKFASVMGEAIADLATEGRSRLPIGFITFRRFF